MVMMMEGKMIIFLKITHIFISKFTDDVTDINIEPLEAISNVTLAQNHDQGTKLTLNWKSSPDVKVVIVFESQPLGFYVERETHGDTLFLNIPSGQVFNVSFKAVYPNGNSRDQSFTSLMADLHQDVNRVFSFSKFLNRTFP